MLTQQEQRGTSHKIPCKSISCSLPDSSVRFEYGTQEVFDHTTLAVLISTVRPARGQLTCFPSTWCYRSGSHGWDTQPTFSIGGHRRHLNTVLEAAYRVKGNVCLDLAICVLYNPTSIFSLGATSTEGLWTTIGVPCREKHPPTWPPLLHYTVNRVVNR